MEWCSHCLRYCKTNSTTICRSCNDCGKVLSDWTICRKISKRRKGTRQVKKKKQHVLNTEESDSCSGGLSSA